MKTDPAQFDHFKELLDQEHSWPSQYHFKFIVQRVELDRARALFQDEEISFRESGSGKYVSLSFFKYVNSSDEVVSVYKKASIIPGLIAL